MKNINKRCYLLLLLVGFAHIHDTQGESPTNSYSQMSASELEKALGVAVEKNNLDAVQALIAGKANVNGKITYTKHNYDDYDTNITCTFIEYAAQRGYVNIVKEFIKAKANIDDMNSALILAAEEGHADVIKELVKAPKININFTSGYLNQTALLKAAKNFPGITAHLATGQRNRTALKNYLDTIKELIKAGAHVNYKDKNENTALIELINNDLYTDAQRQHRAEIIEALLKAGANINHVNDQGNTALIIAIRNHDLNAVENLLKIPKININYANKDGDTALIIAINSIKYTYISGRQDQYDDCLNSQSIITLLLNTPGVNPHHANKKGDTAITLLEKLDAQMNHRF